MKRHHTTAFYLETLILIVVFIGIILVLTRIFGIGRKESASARILTNAVTLSENAAEALSASDTPEKLVSLLNGNGNASYREDLHQVEARYNTDMTPDPQGALTVEVGWEPSETESGVLVNSEIYVRYLEEKEPVYTLQTSVFLPSGT